MIHAIIQRMRYSLHCCPCCSCSPSAAGTAPTHWTLGSLLLQHLKLLIGYSSSTYVLFSSTMCIIRMIRSHIPHFSFLAQKKKTAPCSSLFSGFLRALRGLKLLRALGTGLSPGAGASVWAMSARTRHIVVVRCVANKTRLLRASSHVQSARAETTNSSTSSSTQCR